MDANLFQHFLWHKIFLDTKYFSDSNLFSDPKFSHKQNYFWVQSHFGNTNFFGPTIFLNQNFFVDQKFFPDPKFLLAHNFFGPNICFRIGDFYWRRGINPFQAEHFRLKSCFIFLSFYVQHNILCLTNIIKIIKCMELIIYFLLIRMSNMPTRMIDWNEETYVRK